MFFRKRLLLELERQLKITENLSSEIHQGDYNDEQSFKLACLCGERILLNDLIMKIKYKSI